MISAGAVVSPYSARTVTVDSGNEFSVEARDAFDDISAVPDTVHTGLQLTVSPGRFTHAARGAA